MSAQLYCGDCLDVLPTLEAESVDSIVTDPPYGLSFMGKDWDHGIPGVRFWREAMRVAKPGAHLLAFGGTRTFHRLACAIEDAGWEIRDTVMWVYGSGFPKSHNISKAIDKRGGAQVAWFGPWFREWREENGITQKQVAALFPSKTGGLTGCVANWELGFNMPTPEQFNLIRDTFQLPFDSIEEAEREVVGQDTKARSTNGKSALPTVGGATVYETWDITAPATDAARQWDGWGTALKPAWEPVIVARKPLVGTVAENVLAHGCGGINVDACRVGTSKNVPASQSGSFTNNSALSYGFRRSAGALMETDGSNPNIGRWPANLIHDGSDEVLRLFPVTTSGSIAAHHKQNKEPGGNGKTMGRGWYSETKTTAREGDTGSAARFFYCAKASKRDRDEGCDGLEAREAIHGSGKDGGYASISNSCKSVRNHHPTVKPTDLMRYLCRLVTPPGGIVLDPFAGSGSTLKAAVAEGFDGIGIEQDAEYVDIARRRIAWMQEQTAAEAQMQPTLLEAAD